MKSKRRRIAGDGAELLWAAMNSGETPVVKGDREKYIEILSRLGVLIFVIAKRGFRGADLKRRIEDATRGAIEEMEDAGIEIVFEPVSAQCNLHEFSEN